MGVSELWVAVGTDLPERGYGGGDPLWRNSIWESEGPVNIASWAPTVFSAPSLHSHGTASRRPSFSLTWMQKTAPSSLPAFIPPFPIHLIAHRCHGDLTCPSDLFSYVLREKIPLLGGACRAHWMWPLPTCLPSHIPLPSSTATGCRASLSVPGHTPGRLHAVLCAPKARSVRTQLQSLLQPPGRCSLRSSAATALSGLWNHIAL